MSESRVILICPERDLATPIAEALEKAGTCRVHAVAEVQEAIELVNQEAFDLILAYLNGQSDQSKANELLWSCSTVQRPLQA